jgi:hypothetical protein
MSRRLINLTGFGRLAAILLVTAAMGCSQPAETVPPETNLRTTSAAPTSGPSVDVRTLAEEACLSTEYPNCVSGLLLIAQTGPGSLVAICDYGNETGDIVIIDSESEAEAECSRDGAISPVRVVGVLQLP